MADKTFCLYIITEALYGLYVHYTISLSSFSGLSSGLLQEYFILDA